MIGNPLGPFRACFAGLAANLRGTQLFPERASTSAERVDTLFWFIVAVAALFVLLIFAIVAYFAIRYRRRPGAPPRPVKSSVKLEIAWTVVPLALAMIMFVWGAVLYFDLRTPPANALEVQVIGKQWMWKIQHAEGPREINELHVPVGRPIKLVMTSEDVIHSFSVPAFRIKQDVLPNRFTTLWFTATVAGRYHLFCAQYCGTGHSGMIGWVVAMEPREYERWLAGTTTSEPPSAAGERIFQRLGCATCHSAESGARGPDLRGVFGSTARLKDGSSVVADEEYVRESILDPAAKVVEGYEPIMPTFKGLLTEEQLLQVVAYLRSIGGKGR